MKKLRETPKNPLSVAEFSAADLIDDLAIMASILSQLNNIRDAMQSLHPWHINQIEPDINETGCTASTILDTLINEVEKRARKWDEISS